MAEKWHVLENKEVLDKLQTSEKGLTETEAENRLKQYGYNKIKEFHQINPFKIFLDQFKSFLIYILLIALILLGIMRHWIDFFVILAVILFNASFGFSQQYNAEKAIQTLKQMLTPKTKVLREGKVKEIDISLLVPGDIILLEEGDKIPADARILSINDFETNEATLTGESMPVEKFEHSMHDSIAIGDQKNRIFLGTTVAKGSCRAIVTETGMSTQFGKIAIILQEPEESATPLQKKLNLLSKQMGISVLVLIAVMFSIGIAAGIDKFEMFLTAVSLAVAAIPEGLAAVITLCLAFAVKRMLKVRALIKKLPAAETLGRVTVICSDKTGTITREELKVTEIFSNNKLIHVDKKFLSYLNENEEARLLLKIGCLSSNARFEISKGKDGKEKEYFIGDYTEKALIKFAKEYGFNKEALTKAEPRAKEFPFSSKRKMMSIIRKTKDQRLIVYTKGSPEHVLEHCTKELFNGNIIELKPERKIHLRREFELMASNALRVLGFAYKSMPAYKENEINEELVESGLIFVGFQAMFDAPREEVKEAIERCEKAGISVKMLTGDSLVTAKAVAKQIGLRGEAIEASRFEKMNDAELSQILDKTAIFARINPEDKVRVVQMLKARHQIVAVTGDGVNDAPALKKADIGLAMGIRGSDVTRDVADIVLLDDHFASIVKAVEEGRKVYDNIKKFTYFMISTNFAEVMVVFLALLLSSRFGWSNLLPLLPIQILWVNLVTDGLIAITLSNGNAEHNIMHRKPENMSIITMNVAVLLLAISIFITVPILMLFNQYHDNAAKAQTVTFTALVFFEGFNAFNFSSFMRPFYKRKNNFSVFFAVLITFIMQIALIYLQPLHKFFGTTFLTIQELLFIIGISASVLIIGEIFKITHFHLIGKNDAV
jgi:Ca2+-transporting ATPase